MVDAAPADTGAPDYCGRFAPSTTGMLHLGSATAAIASYVDARAHRGEWLLRIEDLDRSRHVVGADQGFMRDLERLGLCWDRKVVWQSQRLEHYRAALDALLAAGDAYPCACTRRALVNGRYPGTCRSGLRNGQSARSVRVRVDDQSITVDDALQPRYAQNLHHSAGDFIALRADGVFAYHLAVVVDDAAQRVNHIVRGLDLLSSSPRQLHLYRLLRLPAPHYAHFGVVMNQLGHKLSKQTFAQAIAEFPGPSVVAFALRALGQPLPAELLAAPCGQQLEFAIEHWQRRLLPVESVYLSDIDPEFALHDGQDPANPC